MHIELSFMVARIIAHGDLYERLAVAEQEIAAGAEGEEFLSATNRLREEILHFS